MYYTVYKITNIINDKIYIGVHRTNDLNDDYLGSGDQIKKSVNKYGKDSFVKEYLQIFDNPEDMFNMESELVNEDFVKRNDNYNIGIGGYGFSLSMCKKGYQSAKKYMTDPAKNLKGGFRSQELKRGIFSDEYKKLPNHWIGRKQKESSKKKIGEKNSIHQKGKGNSQYGMMWIYNLELQESKKIKKDSTIPNGWVKGRKMFK